MSAFHLIADIRGRATRPGMKAREKKQRLADAAAHYLREVGHKAQKGVDPNDRGHDRKLEQRLKRMSPEEVDQLFRGETE